MKTGRRLIGLTGTNASGKGEAAAFFMGRGFTYFSQSDVIRDELRQKNLEPTRDNLIREGNELRQRFGPDILARRVMDKVTGDSIIDSIRNPSEIEYWRIQGNFILLAIDAPVEVRFQRAVSRGRDESAASIEDFKAKEDQEKTRDRMAQQLETCVRMADFLILNDGTLEDFHKKLEAYL
jgi:dephospho-CoA kinase